MSVSTLQELFLLSPADKRLTVEKQEYKMLNVLDSKFSLFLSVAQKLLSSTTVKISGSRFLHKHLQTVSTLQELFLLSPADKRLTVEKQEYKMLNVLDSKFSLLNSCPILS